MIMAWSAKGSIGGGRIAAAARPIVAAWQPGPARRCDSRRGAAVPWRPSMSHARSPNDDCLRETDPMTARRLRLGIAGLGRGFMLMLPTLRADPRLAVVAAADPRPEARRQFEADFGGRAYD